MQDGCKVYMDSYMALNGSCFMVAWIIFKNHFLEVSLTQNQETMAVRNLTTMDLLYFIMCEDPHEIENSLKQHLVEDIVINDFTLHLRICAHTA